MVLSQPPSHYSVPLKLWLQGPRKDEAADLKKKNGSIRIRSPQHLTIYRMEKPYEMTKKKTYFSITENNSKLTCIVCVAIGFVLQWANANDQIPGSKFEANPMER
jgi:hypothetical protein